MRHGPGGKRQEGRKPTPCRTMQELWAQVPTFVRLNDIPLYGETIFIHLSADGALGCFHIFAIVNNTALSINAQVPP